MKNLIRAFTVMLLALQMPLYAQNIHLTADSVSKLLCKKWEIDYVISQGKRIDLPSPKAQVFIEFYKDGTLSMTGGEHDGVEKGSWAYDFEKGIIAMTMEGNGSKNIISLTKNQLAIPSDNPPAVSTDSRRIALKVTVYFKAKQE